MNETIQHQKMEIGVVKKIQTGGILKKKNLSKKTGITDTSFNNWIKDMEDKMLGFQNKIEEIDITVKLLSLKKILI